MELGPFFLAALTGAFVASAVTALLALRLKGRASYPCHEKITLTLDPSASPPIAASPDPAVIGAGGTVSWKALTEAGDAPVEISFKTNGGPFEHDPDNEANPRKGEYRLLPNGKVIFSNRSIATGAFDYKILWKRQGKTYEVDPRITIKN